MNKNRIRAAALLLSLALLLGGCAAAEAPAPTDGVPETEQATPTAEGGGQASAEAPADAAPDVTLWARADSPLLAGINALVDEYNGKASAPVRLRLFASEKELADALRAGEPDLLLCCGGQEMLSLAEEGRLQALAFSETNAPHLTPLFRNLGERAGGLFFPLGADLPVLVLREENRSLLDSCGSLEALCAAAASYAAVHNAPFFSADSFCQLFACAMAQKGSPFQADRETDRSNEDFRTIYNLLADTAFEGGLVSVDEPVLSAVLRGGLVCGICSCRDLRGTDLEGIVVLPLPPMEGCTAMTEASVWGLAAMPSSEHAEAASAFVGWLFTGERCADMALDALMIPAVEGSWERETGPVPEGFRRAAESCHLFLPAEDSGYARNGTDFERSFRDALALLA